jgi:hypothetical protein
MKKYYWVILLVILVAMAVIFGIRFSSGEDDWICQNNEWVKHGNPSAPKPVGNCGEITENQNNQIKDQSQPITEASIVVFIPKENATVSSPFDIEGKARVFENMVSIRLKDKIGKILFQGTTDAQSPDMGEFGLFQTEIKYATSQTEGTLEVFEASAKDGSDINKVIIPVKFGNKENE